MRMAHITIQTAAYRESIEFYQKIAGLKTVREIKGKGPYEISFLADAEGETCVELIDRPENKVASDGISIGFGVEDVEGYRAELEEKGYEPSPMVSPNPVTKFFFVKDPNGISVQFINE